MEKKRIDIIKSIIYSVLNLFQIMVLGLALMIYTSLNKNLPWHDSCGMQFLIIPMIFVPALLVIGVGLIFLCKKYNINKLNIKLPFYSAVLIFIPILDGSLNRVLIAIGGWICVAPIIVTIYFVIIHFKNYNNKQETSDDIKKHS